jgi:hypothetical protein
MKKKHWTQEQHEQENQKSRQLFHLKYLRDQITVFQNMENLNKSERNSFIPYLYLNLNLGIDKSKFYELQEMSKNIQLLSTNFYQELNRLVESKEKEINSN